MTTAATARPARPWNKARDILLARAVAAVHGEVVHHRRGSHSRQLLPWAEISAHLRRTCAGEFLEDPDMLAPAEVNRRWTHTLRVWYARALARNLPPDDGLKHLRAPNIDVQLLVRLLEGRDYDLESRPGPKKGAKRIRRTPHSAVSTPASAVYDAASVWGGELDAYAEDFSEYVLSPASDEADLEAAHRTPPPPTVLPLPSAPLLTAASARRLEEWKRWLRLCAGHPGYALHLGAGGAELAPDVVVTALLDEGDAPPALLVPVARALASPSWAPRIISSADDQAIAELVAKRASFIAVPAAPAPPHEGAGASPLFTVVLFPTGAAPPLCWHFAKQAARSSHGAHQLLALGSAVATRVTELPGLPADAAFVPALHALHCCVRALEGDELRSDGPPPVVPWPGMEAVRTQLQALLLLRPQVSLCIAAPSSSQPVARPLPS